ncbi:MAG: hypothetical protein ACM3JI_00545 [Anaerolineae bacterium]
MAILEGKSSSSSLFNKIETNQEKPPFLKPSNDSITDIYNRYREKIPELSVKITESSLDPKSSDFEAFYQNHLLKWVIANPLDSEKQEALSSSVSVSDTAQTIDKWKSDHFSHHPQLICLYPGGQLDLVNPYKYCDPDVLVIVDPQPCARKLDSWEDISQRFCDKILRIFQNAKISSSQEFTTNEIEIGPSGVIYWQNLDTNKNKELHVLSCKAGEELFKGSPVENRAHMMISRLPTFDTSVSFDSVKDEGLILYFTPNRDGKNLFGTIWSDLYDSERIPHILKKTGLFIDQKNIAIIEELNNIAEKFHQKDKKDDEFLKAFSNVERILCDHYKESAAEKIKTLKNEWASKINNKISNVTSKGSFILDNHLLPQESEERFKNDILEITRIYTTVLHHFTQET